MSAQEALRNGDLKRALSDLQDEVRSAPAEAKHRVFLFQLLAVLGQWDRALNQLNVAREMDTDALAMAQVYQQALQCEALREQVFMGQRTPTLFGEPEAWMGSLLEAARLVAIGKVNESESLRNQAFEAAPATAGKICLHNREARTSKVDADDPGEPFEWIADADSRFGPILEAIVNGRYFWVPFARIERVIFEKPVDLRDVVWTPAHFTWSNGGDAVGLIPTRYPGSHADPDDAVRLARKTNWSDRGAGVFCGTGQRVLATDVAEYSLLDIQQIVIEHSPASTDQGT